MCGVVISACGVVYGAWCSVMYSVADRCALAVDEGVRHGIGTLCGVQSVVTA